MFSQSFLWLIYLPTALLAFSPTGSSCGALGGGRSTDDAIPVMGSGGRRTTTQQRLACRLSVPRGLQVNSMHRSSRIRREATCLQAAVTKASELVASTMQSSPVEGNVLGSGGGSPITAASSLMVVGEADRAFRLGSLLERNGQARKASAAFHEAATLYQCYLESRSEFAHVTSLPDDECVSILAYTAVRLAFLNQDALGDPNAAVRLYKEAVAIDPSPSASSYDGIGESLEAASGGARLDEAREAYQKALELAPDNRVLKFHLALALERLGRPDEAEPLFERLRRSEAVHACLVDSWGYVRWHTRNIPTEFLNLYRGTRDMLELALTSAMPLIERGGLICEFGVGGGKSLRMAQEILPLDATLHGFDTFTGLPQAWGTEPAGAYSTGGAVPSMDGNVFFYKGLFSDTIPPFLEARGRDAFLAFANVDCDLYTSTLDVLEAFQGRLVPGTVLVFDEYIGHATWRQDEFRAWRECCKKFGWKYEYLGFSFSTKQAVVRIIDT